MLSIDPFLAPNHEEQAEKRNEEKQDEPLGHRWECLKIMKRFLYPRMAGRRASEILRVRVITLTQLPMRIVALAAGLLGGTRTDSN